MTEMKAMVIAKKYRRARDASASPIGSTPSLQSSNATIDCGIGEWFGHWAGFRVTLK